MYKDIEQQIVSSTIADTAPTIVAVSKKQSLEKIEEAYQQGARHFGENYLQEAEEKIQQFSYADMQWHFIGAIQSNKTRKIAGLFDWVHTVDSLAIGKRLNSQRTENASPLNVCVQVNIDNEPQKAGCLESEALSLAKELDQLPMLHLRGIMVIPKAQDIAKTGKSFARAKALFDQLKDTGLAVDTLSMGMSQDYLLAIEKGSTMVRIGSAIFGARS